MKITYPITRYLNTYIARFAPLPWMAGCAVTQTGSSITRNRDTKTTQSQPWVIMPEPGPRRSVEDRKVQCPSQEGPNIRPGEGQVREPTKT